MNNYFTVLKALFVNKLRFEMGSKKRNKILLFVALAFSYALVMFTLIFVLVSLKDLLSLPLLSMAFYFFMLITGALIVLIFGIINLVNTLYLSKDTDFYSMLPIKSSTVFAAKMTYVYLSEAAIVAAILLPLILTFGIVTKLWAAYYVISILTLIIVPALPLVVAAILAIPVMFIASKLKNRGLASLIFYMVLFGGGFALYMYFMFASTDVGNGGGITEETLNGIADSITGVLYALYPYTALSLAALGIPSYGLGVGGSVAVNLLIFIGSSAALAAILMLLAKLTYAKSAKANNQTNGKAIKGEFKTSSNLRALIKREYVSSMRTTQVAFQCYAVFLLPIIFAIMFSIVFGNFNEMTETAEGFFDNRFGLLFTFATLLAMMITVNNGAATSFSREGTAFASLKVLPVNGKRILLAKALSWTVIAVPVTAVAVVLVNVFNFDLTFFLLSFFSFVPLSALFVFFGALWDLTAPKLKWTDPRQAIKQNFHVFVGQLFGMISGFVLIVLTIVLIANLVDFEIICIVFWAYVYATAVIFAAADIILYRKVEGYYARIEI